MIGGGIKSGDMSNIVRTQGDNNVTIVNNIDESLVTRLIKSMIADNLLILGMKLRDKLRIQ